MIARRTRMLATVLGTAFLVTGIAPAAVLAGGTAALPSAVQTAALGTEFAVQYARFYPRKDDYRDTNVISGTTLVPATVTIRIYTSGGTRIKSFLLGTKNGAYSVVWNGRKKDNSLFPQGKYTVKQFVSDGLGTTETSTHTVVLSHKKLYWYLGSLTRYADTGAFFVTEGARAGVSGKFSRGVNLFGGSIEPGYAAGRYTFALPAATVYSSLRVSVYGESEFGPGDHEAFGRGYMGIRNLQTGALDAQAFVEFTTGWYSNSVAAPDHMTSDFKAQAWMFADADAYAQVDYQKVRLTYKYALLQY